GCGGGRPPPPRREGQTRKPMGGTGCACPFHIASCAPVPPPHPSSPLRVSVSSVTHPPRPGTVSWGLGGGPTVGAKVFAGFLVVLATFGGVSAYAVWRIARIGDRLRANQAYLVLALRTNELHQSQEALTRLVDRQPVDLWHLSRLGRLDEAI